MPISIYTSKNNNTNNKGVFKADKTKQKINNYTKQNEKIENLRKTLMPWNLFPWKCSEHEPQ